MSASKSINDLTFTDDATVLSSKLIVDSLASNKDFVITSAFTYTGFTDHFCNTCEDSIKMIKVTPNMCRMCKRRDQYWSIRDLIDITNKMKNKIEHLRQQKESRAKIFKDFRDNYEIYTNLKTDLANESNTFCDYLDKIWPV